MHRQATGCGVAQYRTTDRLLRRKRLQKRNKCHAHTAIRDFHTATILALATTIVLHPLYDGTMEVVGPCVACSLRSRVAPAPEVLCFAPLSIVMKQEPQKTEQAKNLKSPAFTRMAQQHHHENLSQHFQPRSDNRNGTQCYTPEPKHNSSSLHPHDVY